MKNQNPKRTKRMVMHEIMEMLGGPGMKEEFIRLFDHQITAPDADTEMTEEEYQFALQKIREEMPAFKRYLLSLPPVIPEPSRLA